MNGNGGVWKKEVGSKGSKAAKVINGEGEKDFVEGVKF